MRCDSSRVAVRCCGLVPSALTAGFGGTCSARTGPVQRPPPVRRASDSQYWRANVDPSDRYVQSLPGSGQYRLRADASGFDNLFLAGDWIDSGLNAGCIEAATLGGLQAGNAIKGKRLDAGTSGGYRPLGAGDPGAVARA